MNVCIDKRETTDVDTVDDYLEELHQAVAKKTQATEERVRKTRQKCAANQLRSLNGVHQHQIILGEYLLHLDAIYQRKLQKKEELKLELDRLVTASSSLLNNDIGLPPSASSNQANLRIGI